MENGIITTGNTGTGTHFELDCNESCARNRYLRGGCDCTGYLTALAEFKRDIFHEKFIAMVQGVGS